MSKNYGLQIHYNRLPHWRLAGSIYFVTWRLQTDRDLLRPAERTLIADCLKYFDRVRYRLYGYVVMDDHVHLVIKPLEPYDLSQLLKYWKSYAAHAIQKLRGLSGSLWQKDSFNRIVRDEAEFLEKLQYMLNNPLKRWPDVVDYPWVEWFPWD